MKNFLLFFASFCFYKSFAFDFPHKHRIRKPPEWDTLFYKNELSVDLRVPVGFLLNFSTGDNVVFGATYLRAFSKSDFFRVSTRHRIWNFYEQRNSFSENLPIHNESSIINDSVVTISHRWYNYYSPDLRLGYEHRFGKRRVKAIIGIDLILGAEIEKQEYNYDYYQLQFITNAAGETNLAVKEIERDLRFTETKAVNLKVGGTPFVGMLVHISKRFSFRALAMYDLYLSHNLSFNSNNSTRFPPNDNVFNLNFNNGLIAELGFTAHFGKQN